jgi:sugar phosphate isomerase/epimerase
MRSAKSRSLGRNDLIVSSYTISGAPVFQLPRFSFAERVAAAAAAGFSGIGIAMEDYTACRQRGTSGTEMRRILDDHGIAAAELEFLMGWWNDGEAGERSRAAEQTFYDAAEALGARHMNVGAAAPHGTLPPLPAVADHFAALCERAAAHDLIVALEFLPWSDIPDAATAGEIVRFAGPNGGILIDTWHYFRGAADPAQVRSIPGDRFVAIQFDDADAVRVGGFMEDTTDRRRMPGQGDFDLVGFIRMLDEIGVQAPISVEILSAEQRARPLAEAAQMAYETSRAVVTRARA